MICILIAIFLTNSAAGREVIDVIVTFRSRLWQHEISEFLTLNASCSLGPEDFVWRRNPAAISLPTDFGIVRLTADAVIFENFKRCALSQIKSVKRIDIDSPPYSRSVLSRSRFHDRKSKLSEDYDNTNSHMFSYETGIDGDKSSRGFKLIRPFEHNSPEQGGRNLLKNEGSKKPFVPASIAAHSISRGYLGQGVKVAIFDSGLNANHPHFSNIYERTNWTNDETVDDLVGHGSFVAGVIAGRSPECPGIAPESSQYIFRVFSTTQQSYTSWFLDAFNYALFLGVDVINFSIGGPDHADAPFMDKINELSANGIIVISAVGNDGPLWGTILNPADQPDVLSVGGWRRDDDVAAFSSRGMTTSELSRGGMGRVKPDILAPSVSLYSSSGSKPYRCVTLSGTSVATPMVTGAVAVLLSHAFQPLTAPRHNSTEGGYNSSDAQYDRKSPRFLRHKNIAAMKQIIMSSAHRLNGPGIFEQGAGTLDLDSAVVALNAHRPHTSLHPPRVSNLAEDCPYLWPWCLTAIYPTSQPLMINFTILNSMGLVGRVTKIKWEEKEDVESKAEGNGTASVGFDGMADSSVSIIIDKEGLAAMELGILTLKGRRLTVCVQYSSAIYPYTGYLAMSLRATDKRGLGAQSGTQFIGKVSGKIYVTVETPGPPPFVPGPFTAGDDSDRNKLDGGLKDFQYDSVRNVQSSTAVADVVVLVSPTPPREKRLLWDVFHNIGYPSAYVPRDDLQSSRNFFDWMGDHPYTNFKGTYTSLLSQGYSVEILRSPWTCFDASQYHALLIVDPEEAFEGQEVDKLVKDIRILGLSVVLIADWYDELLLLDEKYIDDNTRSTWYPITGGANVPAINGFLGHFKAQLGMQSFNGKINMDGSEIAFLSGNTIAEWPLGGVILKARTGDLGPCAKTNLRANTAVQAVAGFLEVESGPHSSSAAGSKTAAPFGNASTSDSGRGPSASISSDIPTSPSSPSPPSRKGKIVVYGDSACFDLAWEPKIGCEKLLASFLDFTHTGSLLMDLKLPKQAIIGNRSSVVSEYSQYELLTRDRFSQQYLLSPSRPLSKAELSGLAEDSRKRAWEFSR